MPAEQRIPVASSEWRDLRAQIHTAMELTSRMNALPYGDLDERNRMLAELFGAPLPAKAIVFPPFYCTRGLGIRLGEAASVGHASSFLDLGGITIGARTMISPKVTLITEGHPVELAERREYITVAPIVIEDDVWIGAAATVLPGVRIGRGAVVGAGAVIARDVAPHTVVTGPGQVERGSTGTSAADSP